MADERGVHRKFEVRRTDGSSEPGRKHENCAYFVLDLAHDPFAVAALEAYADACAKEHPALAADLRRIVARQDPSGAMHAALAAESNTRA